MAMACLRLVTRPPLPPFPLRSVPRFRRRRALATSRLALGLYLRLLVRRAMSIPSVSNESLPCRTGSCNRRAAGRLRSFTRRSVDVRAWLSDESRGDPVRTDGPRASCSGRSPRRAPASSRARLGPARGGGGKRRSERARAGRRGSRARACALGRSLRLRSGSRWRDLLHWRGKLPHHGGSGLVLAQTEERRVTHPPVLRPFAEAHLGHQLRLDPVWAADTRRLRREGTSLALERAQPARELPQRLFREACADLPRVDQAALLVHAGEERPQAHPRAFRIGVAPDDDLLPLGAFDLEPLAASRAAIGRVPQLGHDALETVPAGLGEEGGAVAHHMIAVADGARRITHRSEQIGEEAFAVLQACPHQIEPVQVQEVEDEVGELARVQSREMVLQRLEARGPVLQQHGDLAVEEGTLGVETHQSLRDRREIVRPVTAVPAEEAHAAVLDAGEDAVAIVLHLVEPRLARGRAVDEDRQLGREKFGQGRLARARDLVRAGATRTAAAARGACPGRARLGRSCLASLPVRMPDATLGGGDLIEGAPGAHALGPGVHDAGVMARARRFVPLLDEEPAPPIVIATLTSPDPHEGPSAVELLAVEGELEIAVPVAFVRIAHGLPGPAVPHHHGATTVLALRNDALEAAVFERMILHLHGEALVGRVEARALGHRPALERAVELEPEIVMEMAGCVLLDHEGQIRRSAPAGPRALARRLGSGLEVPLATILA